MKKVIRNLIFLEENSYHSVIKEFIYNSYLSETNREPL